MFLDFEAIQEWDGIVTQESITLGDPLALTVDPSPLKTFKPWADEGLWSRNILQATHVN